jgi:hypothetical protein
MKVPAGSVNRLRPTLRLKTPPASATPPARPAARPRRAFEPINPIPTLVDQLDAILHGDWPGELRQLVADPPKPLAIGIVDQLVAGRAEEDQRALHRWLQRWTNMLRYKRALSAEGAMRFGLDGAPVEPVSHRHRSVARTQAAARLLRYYREAQVFRESGIASTSSEGTRRNGDPPSQQ